VPVLTHVSVWVTAWLPRTSSRVLTKKLSRYCLRVVLQPSNRYRR